MKNILIIDAQPLYSEALAQLVKNSINAAKVIQSTDVPEIMRLVRLEMIHLIILDVVIGHRDGMCLARSILAAGYQGKILFISSKDYSCLSKAAFLLGANGFLDKNDSKEAIIEGIIGIFRGYSLFKDNGARATELSKREAMVFHYLAQGYTNKRVSEQLSISEKTVSTYKMRILKKYQAKSIIELLYIMSSQKRCI